MLTIFAFKIKATLGKIYHSRKMQFSTITYSYIYTQLSVKTLLIFINKHGRQS